MFLADRDRVRKVFPVAGGNNNITTYAGDGSWQTAGDGGPAISASFNYATGVFVDSTGVVFIAEYTNIRRISAFAPNIIMTIAGTGAFYYERWAARGDAQVMQGFPLSPGKNRNGAYNRKNNSQQEE